MYSKKLVTVQKYLNSHLAKRFIQGNLASYFLSVFFIEKWEKKIRFYVDFKRSNTIIK